MLARLKLLTQGRWLWTRTIGSTVVGQAVVLLAAVTIWVVAWVAGVYFQAA